MSELRFVDACTEEHFAAMSGIHCRGWRAAYPGHVPDDYLRDVITEDHWIPYFREDHETGRCRACSSTTGSVRWPAAPTGLSAPGPAPARARAW